MPLFIFLSLSIGTLGYLSRILLRGRKKLYSLVTLTSFTSIAGGLIAFGFVNLIGTVAAAITIYVIIRIAMGLETDKAFFRNIYDQIDRYRKDDPGMNDEEIMMKVFRANFPDTSRSVNKRIIETSEDIEEMLLRAVEYESSGKLKNDEALEDSEGP